MWRPNFVLCLRATAMSCIPYAWSVRLLPTWKIATGSAAFTKPNEHATPANTAAAIKHFIFKILADDLSVVATLCKARPFTGQMAKKTSFYIEEPNTCKFC